MSTTKLFLDWMNVDKGAMEATLDSERISDEGRAIIERNKKMFGIYPDLSGHGMKRSRLPFGVKIAVEPARKSAPWLVADKPWEKALLWVTVIHDEGKYRCWYSVAFPKPLGDENAEQTFHEGRQMDTGTVGLCYAESADGLHWVKPELGMFAFEGSKANNIVAIWQMSETAVFRDPVAPPEERYKAFIWDKVSSDPNRADYGLFGAVSPDGLRWSRLPEPLIREFCDTQNVVYWCEQKKKYVGYFRGGLGGRAIRYAETDDFRHWPSPEIIAHSGPLDHPSDDYYNNGFTRHPDDPAIKLIFNSVFHHNTDLLDVRLGVTHTGKVVNWVSYEPIIPVGKPGDWDCGAVYVGPNMVRLPDGALAVPYHGLNHTHGEGAFSSFYREYNEHASGYAWAQWDDGRIAGIEAEDHGEFWTSAETCTGEPIEINARTSKVGRVEVELWESLTGFVSKPIPGFTFDECVPFTGDAPWTPLRWRGRNDLSELKGKRIQLRVRLSSAKIFGYRLHPDSGAVTSWQVSDLTSKQGGGLADAPCRDLAAPLAWRALDAGADGFVNVHDLTGDADGIVYLAHRFRVENAERRRLQVGHDGGVKVFVDGKDVLFDPERRNPAVPARSQAEVDLAAGDHDVVIAFDTAAGNGWGIFFSWAAPAADAR